MKKQRAVSLLASVVVALLSGGCAPSASGPAQGAERGACYPNSTCNAGLTCLSNVCVNTNTGDAATDAAPTDATPTDALASDVIVLADATTPDTATADATATDTAPATDAPAPDSGPAVDVVTPDASVADAQPDVQPDVLRIDDGGIPCPGAVLFHPGTETRMVGASVPFIGHGRGTACEVLTGAALSWRDSLEGAIGTGESFNHAFTMLGTHTVTVTATYSGGTATASVTFMITLTGM